MPVAPERFAEVHGSTDTEVVFQLALSLGLEDDPIDAMERTVGVVEEAARKRDIAGAVQGTFGISDGRTLWAVRYATEGTPRSLYASADVAAIRRLHPENPRFQRLGRDDRLIVSEPFRTCPASGSRSRRRRGDGAPRRHHGATAVPAAARRGGGAREHLMDHAAWAEWSTTPSIRPGRWASRGARAPGPGALDRREPDRRRARGAALGHARARLGGDARVRDRAQDRAARDVAGAAAELARLRRSLDEAVRDSLVLRAAAAGTHPLATRAQVAVSSSPRYREIAETMRVLAQREPTMAQHVHVGVPDGAAAVRALDGLRRDLPLLLALSANSPYWRGNDTGFASARTPIP